MNHNKNEQSINFIKDSASDIYSKASIIARNQKILNDEFASIASLPDEKRIPELKACLDDPEIFSHVKHFNANQLMQLFVMFRSNKCFDYMIKLYNMSDNLGFKESIMVKEQVMVAYNKTGDSNSALQLGLNMIENGQASGDVYGAIGKAYFLSYKNENDKEKKKEWLLKSISAYEEGFSKYMEFYPGINAAYKYIELSSIEEDPAKAQEYLKKASHISKIVTLCTLKEGANETNDYWCAATRLEAACISLINGGTKDYMQIDNAIAYLSKFSMESWAWDTTIDSLKNLKKNFSKENNKKIDEVISILGTYKNSNNKNSLKFTAGYDDKMNSIVSSSYNYRGLASNFEGSSSVGGNIRFGGQLPDHVISRKDVEFVDKIMDTKISDLFPKGAFEKVYDEELRTILQDGSLKLKDIRDIDIFLKTIDKFIRYHFGTDNFANTGLDLEKNAEINNSVYDQTVSSLLKIVSKHNDRTVDSRTNISSLFILGLGDCRHHAQVKQLLFDRWQSDQMDSILTRMYKYGINDDQLRDFNDVYRTQLRTIDVQVTLPIRLGGENNNQIYNPLKKDGKYIYDENQTNPLEDHTMTILLTINDNNELSEAKIADAFYQRGYNWANHELDVEKDINIVEGKYVINAGTISGDRVNIGEDIPVIITPTPYAGKRDNSANDELGTNIRLLGITLDVDDIVISLEDREKTIKALSAMRNYSLSNLSENF